jgi:hypothetical protein
MKSLWEKCQKFGVLVDFADVLVKLPREGDQWFMKLLEAAGFTKDELKRLNRECGSTSRFCSYPVCSALLARS